MMTTDARVHDLLRQSRLERRDPKYDGHDRAPGAAKGKKQHANRTRRRKQRQWVTLALR